jgi:hypothetical protein
VWLWLCGFFSFAFFAFFFYGIHLDGEGGVGARHFFENAKNTQPNDHEIDDNQKKETDSQPPTKKKEQKKERETNK